MIVSVFHMNVSALMFGLLFLFLLLSASAESPPLGGGPPATAYRETVTLPSVLSFGFFAGTAVREPTQEEVDGLLVQTTRFYSDLFSTHYDPLILEDDVTLDATQATLDAPNSHYPVRIDFSTSATFFVETADSDAVPTRQELGDLMQGADYSTYIQNFVWTADPPQGLFYDVQRVVFDYDDAPDPDVPSDAPTGVETYYPTYSPTYVPWSVGLELRVAFGLFDDGTVRVPTPDEMDAWKQATHDFFLAHLQSKYPGHCHDGEEYCHEFIESMTIHVRDTFLDDESSPLSSTHPIVIHWSARIEMNTGISMDAMPTREQLYADLNCVDFEDYMENHVRTSGPKDGIFSFAQRVKLFRRNGDTAYQPITSPCGPTVAPTVPPSEVPTDYGPTFVPMTTAPTRHPEHVRLVTVKATMEFGLDQNASIREPTPQESIAVMNQTSRFFTKHLTTMYPNRLDAFQAKFVKSYLLEETNSLYPIRIEFDAQAFFVEEALVPSEEDLFEKMDSADFDNDYINNYLSNSPAETGMFHKTQRVDFNRRHQFSERDKWVYCVDPTSDSLYILDSTTGKTVKTILTLNGYRAPVGMAESGGYLYVFNNAPTSLLKIDPGSLEVTQISTGGSNALGLAFGNGKLYTKLENSRDLVALDLETGEPTIVCPKIFPSSEVGGLEIDPHNGLLYGVQAYNSDSARMYTIDPVQCSFTRICTMELTGVNGGLNSLVWNPTTDMFLASLDPNLILDLDIDCTITNVRQTEGPSPSGMAMYFRPSDHVPTLSPTLTPSIPDKTSWVYAVDSSNDRLYILDSISGELMVDFPSFGSSVTKPVTMAANDGTLYVYNNLPKPGLLQVDPRTGEATPSFMDLSAPVAGSISFRKGVLYGKFQGSTDLVSYDPDKQSFRNVVCSEIFPSYNTYNTVGLDVDPTTDLLYLVSLPSSSFAEMYAVHPDLCTLNFAGVISQNMGEIGSIVWNPSTNKFLASSLSGKFFDLDTDGKVSNIRSTAPGFTPQGLAMYFDPVEIDPLFEPTPSATGAPSLTYEPTPGYPAITCYDFWGDGEVLDSKCYAVDISFCTEESATCTFVESFYEYYNQYTTDVGSTRETYAYVSVLAAYDCVDRPDECSINVAGVNCNECTNDGLAVTMVDCTNIPEGVMEGTFAPAPQTISLSEGGGSFDIIATENMCNHPSVVAVADRSFVKMATKDTLMSKYSFVVPSELHFQFAEGKGADLDFDALAHLMTKTLAFFNTVLPGALDSALLGNIEIDDVHTDYDKTEPDSLVVFFNTNIDLKSTSTITSRNVVHAMATADWNKYVDQYVHQQKGPHAATKSILDGVSLVIFRGIGRASP